MCLCRRASFDELIWFVLLASLLEESCELGGDPFVAGGKVCSGELRAFCHELQGEHPACLDGRTYAEYGLLRDVYR